VPAQDIIQAADDNTVEIFHYDISPNGINGTYPIDDLYDDSLICWLEMQNQNNAGTYIVDKSRYGIHGRINGPTSTNGINGKALSFDGSNDTVEFGNVLNMGTKDMSICMWVKTTNATNEMWIISKSYAGAQN
jgi:hypothetical protein